MDIKKLLEDSDLIAAPEVNKRLQGKVQASLIMPAQTLEQRKTAGDRVKC